MNILWIVVALLVGLIAGGYVGGKISAAFTAYLMEKEMKKGNLFIYKEKSDEWMPCSPVVGFAIKSVMRKMDEDGGFEVKAEAESAYGKGLTKDGDDE